jgi:hypothetical protein
MSRHGLLRALALGMVTAAVLDPGCAVTRHPVIRLVVGQDVAPDTVVRIRRLGGDAHPTSEERGDGSDTIRIGVGRPAELLTAHRERRLAVAVRPPGADVHVSDVVLPGLAVEGMSSVVRVRVVGHGLAAGTSVLVDVRADATRQRVGQGDAPLDDRGVAWVDVPLIPSVAGRWPLCVEVRLASAQTVSRCERIELEVLSQDIRVDVFEGRPSWTARFARLGLERSDSALVHATAHVAPSITVSTRPRAADRDENGAADVVLVGGLDGLTDADVARLTREARDGGRTVVLLADAPLQTGRLRSLWPTVMSSVVAAPLPQRIAIGPHTWRAREWLAPAGASTDVEPLAYLDASPPVPVVMARPLGTGRIVLVAALDIWRWRLADDVAFDAGWQALVLSLAADARLARRPSVWRLAGPLGDEVHVARVVQGLPAASADDPAAVRIDGDVARAATWLPAGGGDIQRARLSLTRSSGPRRVVVPGDASDERNPDVIELGTAVTRPATWDDLQRVVHGDGGQVVDEADLSAVLRRLDRTSVADEARWFVTRQWWFAAIVTGTLGLEWWWRRLARRR